MTSYAAFFKLRPLRVTSKPERPLAQTPCSAPSLCIVPARRSLRSGTGRIDVVYRGANSRAAACAKENGCCVSNALKNDNRASGGSATVTATHRHMGGITEGARWPSVAEDAAESLPSRGQGTMAILGSGRLASETFASTSSEAKLLKPPCAVPKPEGHSHATFKVDCGHGRMGVHCEHNEMHMLGGAGFHCGELNKTVR
jgi:hypothetical protein